MRNDWRAAAERVALALAGLHLARWDPARSGRARTLAQRMLDEVDGGSGALGRAVALVGREFGDARARRLRRALRVHLRRMARSAPSPVTDVEGLESVLAALPVARRRVRSAAVLAAAWPEVPDDVKANVLPFLASESRRVPGTWGRMLRRVARSEQKRIGVRPPRGRLGRTLLKTALALVGGFALGSAIGRSQPFAVPRERGSRTDEATTAAAVATVAMPLGSAPVRRVPRRRRRKSHRA